jgi:hypothetical protein
MPKEITRVMTKPTIPRSGFGSTFQILLSELWSCANTPVAPKRAVTAATTVARMPDLSPCFAALSTIVWTANAPSRPTKPSSSR